ncbi:MAG TPA: hypothetical protein VEA69_13600 [Tepidisphaeraceae bacterium]|nr:hypothetical protein [Tepidisphaeraceae bacterium]
MHTFASSASDDEIRAAVVDWSELLAEKRYAEALGMFPPAEAEMTPAELGKWIAEYGSPEPFPDGRVFAVTSLRGQPDFQRIVDRIDVNRADLFGLDPTQYVGMVHYDGVPLNGLPSDLTARFHIKKVVADRITLEFLDIHVM